MKGLNQLKKYQFSTNYSAVKESKKANCKQLAFSILLGKFSD